MSAKELLEHLLSMRTGGDFTNDIKDQFSVLSNDLTNDRIVFPAEFVNSWWNTVGESPLRFISTAANVCKIPIIVRGGRMMLKEEEWNRFRKQHNVGRTPVMLFEDVDNNLCRYRVRFFGEDLMEIRPEWVPDDELPIRLCIPFTDSSSCYTTISLGRAFSRNFGWEKVCRSKIAEIKYVDGSLHNVALKYEDHKFSFAQGWEELTMKCNLRTPSVLFFEYIGGLSFRMKSTYGHRKRLEYTQNSNNDVYNYMWYPQITEATFNKNLPLHAPHDAMKSLFLCDQMVVDVLLPSGEWDLWPLEWNEESSPGTGTSIQCFIADAWNDFIATLTIPCGHRLRFRSLSNESFLRVEIVKSHV